MSNVIGPDVSFYQDDPATPQGIDFVKMRGMTPYVIVRAGQNKWADRDVKKNWAAAKAAGLLRGSYWFYDSRVEPQGQAELWVSLLAHDLGELPLFCDFEDSYGGPFGRWRDWYDFLERLKALTPGKEIAIYTAYYYWKERTLGAGIPITSLNYFKQYPLWIANYGVAEPLIPLPWDTWLFWQFTSSGDGSQYGVESKEIDLSYFNGDLAAFGRTYGASTSSAPPLETPQENKMNYTMTTIYNITRIRKDHNTFAEVLTSVNANVTVSGDELWTAPADGAEVKKGDQWLHIAYGGFTGWMALTHKGEAVCKDLKEIGAPVPPPVPTPTPAPQYQDVAVHINIFDNAITVLVNGDEWIKKQ